MSRDDLTIKEAVIHQTKATGVLPCIKLKEKQDCLAIAKAMYDGGARVIEITMTTAGTVLDAQTAREVILHGGSLIVNPAVIPEVIQMANRYSIPVYSGAFTATEVLTAMEAGASMVKIFPAQLGGPKYMTNLKMVFPQVNLIPSGGISLENAAEYIRCGACAVSGARTFMDTEKVREEGIQWITGQVSRFIQAVLEAKQSLPELP
ncbi:MAG TPA: bifunctional 4-hydroxy-2-oxoglutarate aldolase/2-dehydro-3-deoxy-phosphogluconate aldolase [Armatimonadota bacterium]|nr:bifunctional 4-hydroxy-2-oxoglutarate aldolase/2-dehydro-3-deoxy-phosphogluconate aldolase [Armatimonadota bacterium]